MRRSNQRNSIDCLVDGRGDMHATLPHCHIATLPGKQELMTGKRWHADTRKGGACQSWEGDMPHLVDGRGHATLPYHTRQEVADD